MPVGTFRGLSLVIAPRTLRCIAVADKGIDDSKAG